MGAGGERHPTPSSFAAYGDHGRRGLLNMPPPFPRAEALGLSLRPMTDEDLPFVAALFASTRAEEVAQTGWPAEQQQAFLAQQHEAQHRHYRTHYPEADWLIVELGGEAIGRLYLVEE